MLVYNSLSFDLAMIIPPMHCMFYFSAPRAFPHRGANCNAREGHRKGPDIRLNLRRLLGRDARASLRALPSRIIMVQLQALGSPSGRAVTKGD